MRLGEPPIDVLAAGAFPTSDLWARTCADVEEAIACVDWPHGTGIFALNPTVKHGNGVKPIKIPFVQFLSDRGWWTESLPPLPSSVLTTGDLDALYDAGGVYVGFEWETGNISSSHRAMNKLVLGLFHDIIRGGLLVLPSDAMRPHITDRIGNIGELRPYLPLWESVKVTDGALRIYTVEHDILDPSTPLIPKGSEGYGLGPA